VKKDIKVNFLQNIPKNYNLLYSSKVNSFYLNSELGSIYKNMGIGEINFISIGDEVDDFILTQYYKIPLGLPLILGLPKVLLKIISKISYLNTLSSHMQPLISNQLKEDRFAICMTEVLEKIYKYAEKNKYSVQMDFICFNNLEIVNQIIKGKNYLKPCATARVDLNKSEKELFENFPKSVKNTLNKNYDTRVEKVDYLTYYKSLKETWNQKGLSVNNHLYYKLLEELPNKAVGFYLIYSSNNQVLAGSCLGYGNKSAIEFSMFATDYSKKEKIPGGDLLKWFLIKEAKKNGAEYYDLNMIEISEAMDSKSQNINFFKTKWGVSIVYGIKFEMYNNRILLLRKLKNILLGK
jgi:hypothetical protein